ncbi:ergothioneine biosynthesis protein EgtB [Dactylosporangium matsuzakiense]|uniref:Hercynine oxygenase n=1 Tax=Dactylosporangium matsuzakiense TaxID=53360 RepID=A0A9W6NP96_9ACTN|nr:ergothioneine biosynthesis protein EgtB [Dactylosporangium matsuzakiense]UWZ42659.1 ergothioneine biosynthesis protein EgtB [Dactylosporangium matsuzakiense]GLL03867.1 hercynine oxygenase [Dactylosporangium matsuzakiense]
MTDLRERVARELLRTRQRSTVLTEAVDDGDLIRQHSPLMSPLVWDLAHIGNQEELWLVRDVGGRDPVRADIDHLYDAFKHARRDRPALPLLNPREARAYVATVRDKVFDVLERVPLEGNRLTEHAFAFGMIVQHEQQHDETMLATHQLRAGDPVLAAAPPPPSTVDVSGEVLVPGGPFTMGTSTEPWALDNERPAHLVDVPAFFIDRAPVTNAQYAAFLDETGAEPPLHWSRDPGGWLATAFGRTAPIVPDAPVVHVSFPEAKAYAEWAGRRLPTEAEWEKAARWDPATGRSRRYPWGDEDPEPHHANLGQRHLAPAPVGAYPAGASPLGVHQLIGDVWEWVDSDFTPYPGFAAFPYREYSEVFFGPDYKILRGGSFGTDAAACRGTFRNWDYPIRRQIFSGFRTARDRSPGELA